MIEVAGERLRVTVPMTMANAKELEARGLSFVAAAGGIVELADVSRLDSSALAVIFSWQRAAALAGKEVHIAHAPESLLSLAALYGVADLLPLA